jgi:hypothetical protein
MRRVLQLVAGLLVCWAALSYPAWLHWGPQALVESSLAVALCLVPAAITLGIGPFVLRQAPELTLLFVIGSMALRMMVVLAGGLAITMLVPGLAATRFWIWVVVFYLWTLVVETTLLVRMCAPAGRRPEAR